MRKIFAAGATAIGLLTAGSVGVLVILTSEGRSRGGAGDPTSPASADRNFEEPRRPVPSTTPIGEVGFGSPPPPAPIEAPVPVAPPPPPPKGSWEAVPITARAKALGRLGGLIQARLNDLQDDLRNCFTADGQARHGGSPITAVKDAAPMDDTGTLVLVLQLEGQAGSVRIVDAPVETRGPAGDDLIACVQSFLRGRVLDVPGANAGTKQRLLFPLTP